MDLGFIEMLDEECKPTEEFKPSNIMVNETFITISGEVGIIPQGQLITVLRLQGCNLRCNYCDALTSQSIGGGAGRAIDIVELANSINKAGLPLLVTGGEPLLQRAELTELFRLLIGIRFIQIETNGTKSIEDISNASSAILCIVMDYKFHKRPLFGNMDEITPIDFIKFVISSVDELYEACYIMGQYEDKGQRFAISATDISLYPDIVKAVEATNNQTLVNVQIHKFIGVQ